MFDGLKFMGCFKLWKVWGLFAGLSLFTDSMGEEGTYSHN